MSDTRDLVSADLGADSAENAAPDGSTVGERRHRRAWYVGAAALVALLAAYIAGALLFGDRVPRSTTVSGVDIGGLSRADAQARLDAELGPQLSQPFEVAVGDNITQITPEDALVMDSAAIVEDAAAGSAWNPVHLVRVLVGGDSDLDAEVSTEGEWLQTDARGDRR